MLERLTWHELSDATTWDADLNSRPATHKLYPLLGHPRAFTMPCAWMELGRNTDELYVQALAAARGGAITAALAMTAVSAPVAITAQPRLDIRFIRSPLISV